MPDAFNACRRVAGGVRSYPLLRGLSVHLQAHVLHCTVIISNKLVQLFFACLPEDVAATSRRFITAVTSERKVECQYLREFRELVAAAVACPVISTENFDPALYFVAPLVPLLTAAWRESLTDPTDVDRAGAAAMTQFAD